MKKSFLFSVSTKLNIAIKPINHVTNLLLNKLVVSNVYVTIKTKSRRSRKINTTMDIQFPEASLKET